METVVTSIANWVSQQGIGVAMLLFAVYWLNLQNKKSSIGSEVGAGCHYY